MMELSELLTHKWEVMRYDAGTKKEPNITADIKCNDQRFVRLMNPELADHIVKAHNTFIEST